MFHYFLRCTFPAAVLPLVICGFHSLIIDVLCLCCPPILPPAADRVEGMKSTARQTLLAGADKVRQARSLRIGAGSTSPRQSCQCPTVLGTGCAAHGWTFRSCLCRFFSPAEHRPTAPYPLPPHRHKRPLSLPRALRTT